MSGQQRCVYCRLQPSDPRWQPFCSERCQLADLGRWLQGDYRVPGPAIETPPDSSGSGPHGGDDEEDDHQY